jgi:hypothetical protein
MPLDIWEECRGEYWVFWIALFLPLINNKHGYFQHLPEDGGYLGQPGTTMNILRAIQGVYFEYLAEVNKVPGA